MSYNVKNKVVLRLRLISYVSFLFLMLSCNNNIIEQRFNSLLGTWELKVVIIAGDGINPIPSGVTITFYEQSKNLIFKGQSVCNLYGGKVENLTREDISLTSFHETQIACANNEQSLFENDYFDWMRDVSEYTIEGDQLILTFNSNDKMSFEILK